MLKRAFQMLVGGERQDMATGEVFTKKEMEALPGIRLTEPTDPVPMAPPIGYKREPSMVEIVKGMILKDKVRQLQEALGADTAEEAEDFDVGEDDEDTPSSLYEHDRHDHELLVAYEKLQRHHQMMHDKYGKPLPDFMKEVGGAGGTPPAEGRSAAGPKAPEGPSKPPEAASGSPLSPDKPA